MTAPFIAIIRHEALLMMMMMMIMMTAQEYDHQFNFHVHNQIHRDVCFLQHEIGAVLMLMLPCYYMICTRIRTR